MLFFYPMWDHESQRIGKQKCTPLGYKLHGIAEGLGFLGFFLLIILCAYLLYRHQVGTFNRHLFWLMAIPFGLGLIGEALYCYSWRLANRKGFHYDYKTQEASWIEDGERQTFKWKSGQSSYTVAEPSKGKDSKAHEG
jgi:hypothetical protein